MKIKGWKKSRETKRWGKREHLQTCVTADSPITGRISIRCPNTFSGKTLMTAESRENIWLRVTTTSVLRAQSISSLILISLVIFSCHGWKINKKKQKKELRGSINFPLLYKYYSFTCRKHTFSTAMLSWDMIISSRIINRVCWIWFTVSERLDGGWDDPSSRERA